MLREVEVLVQVVRLRHQPQRRGPLGQHLEVAGLRDDQRGPVKIHPVLPFVENDFRYATLILGVGLVRAGVHSGFGSRLMF